LRFLPVFRGGALRFLMRLLNMYSSSCKLPRGLRPVHEVPPGIQHSG
jgi:hypothetical protein